MSKKAKKDNRSGIIYSTDPHFDYETTNQLFTPTLPANKQNLNLRIEKKGRGGKTATIISGFVGSATDLKKLSKMLKTKCGAGGSEKDREIIIQGDLKEKINTILSEAGYHVKR